MGLGPIPATRKALARAGIALADLDLVEINEAFAAQAIACMRELAFDVERTNVNGGAIALGHPLGASGARIATTLLHELRRRGGRYGLGDDVHRRRPGHRNGFRACRVEGSDMTTTSTSTAAKTQLLIGGAWRDAADGGVYEDFNPATGAKLADVADATRDDVEAAVAAARRAFDAGKWPTMAASRRAKIVYKLAQLIAERAAEIAMLEVRDNGKTIATAKGEIGAIVDCFEFYAGAATKNYGETLPPPLPTYLANTRARAGRRRRRDRAVELSVAARVVESCAGAGCRLHDRAQAVVGDAAHARSSWVSSRSKPAFPKACSTS